MKRHPLPLHTLVVHVIALVLASIVLFLWIYDVAHSTQPQYSDPDYGLTRTYQP